MLYLLFAFLFYLFKKTRKIKYLHYNCNLVLTDIFFFCLLNWNRNYEAQGQVKVMSPFCLGNMLISPFSHKITMN